MVIWTLPAKLDLKHIHDFIAQDSKFYAKKVVQEILDKTNTISEHPQTGKVIPEIEHTALREFHLYSYRIMYEIKKDACYVLAIIHKRQDFKPEQLP